MDHSRYFELDREPVRYSGHIGFFRIHPVLQAVTAGSSWATIGQSDERWAYLVSNDERELEQLTRSLYGIEGIRDFALLESWMVGSVRSLGPIDSELHCLRHYYPPDTPLPGRTSVIPGPVRLDEVEWICENSEYREYISPEYIAEAIESGFSAAVRVDGALVAWAITHDDLAIGNLHVLPKFRRNGYARAVVVALMEQLRESGIIPVMNIEAGNAASRALARALGFRMDREVYWIKLA